MPVFSIKTKDKELNELTIMNVRFHSKLILSECTVEAGLNCQITPIIHWKHKNQEYKSLFRLKIKLCAYVNNICYICICQLH